MPLVTSGVEYGHLRQLAMQRVKDLGLSPVGVPLSSHMLTAHPGLSCRDVRAREVGIQHVHHKINPNQVELIRRDYFANGGWETFLS